MMTVERAAWVLKNGQRNGSEHLAAVAALREEGGFLRIIYAPPLNGEWEILAVEHAEPPSTPITLYRRAEPEYRMGLFWSVSWLEAWLHTVGRFGLTMYEHTFERADLVAEFVIENDAGRRSGGEYIVSVSEA